jgi:UTP--glucose-1-phosphate uridylyltransferase
VKERAGKSVKKCLFPVAGMGTRFLPATKDIPKEMVPLIDRPLIHYGVDEAVSSGCEEIVLVTGRGKQAIEDYFDRSLELEKALETKGKKIFSIW